MSNQLPDEFADPPAAFKRDEFGDASAVKKYGKITERRSSRTMPHPLTGEDALFMRATRFAQTTADQYMVTEWKMGMLTIGLSRNRGLTAKANAKPIPDEPMEFRPRGWWMPWAKIGHQAIDLADANNGSNLGIAFHDWAEAVDKGKLHISDVLPDWQPHIEAFLQVHKAWGMRTETAYLERYVVNLAAYNKPNAKRNQYAGLCGRLDSLRRMRDGSLMVDDTKTGKNAPIYGLDEIAIQEAVYANSEYIWNVATNRYDLMPEEVRKDIASITWVPINDPYATEVIPIDIEKGWQAATEIAAKALEWRATAKRKNNGIRLSTSALLATCATSLPEHGPDDYEDRLMSCTGEDQISLIFQEAYGLGVWTGKLDALSKIQRNKIRLQHV